MSKIICEICGTSYPESQECCPICGCARDAAADLLSEDVMAEAILETPRTKAPKKAIFDYDEVNPGKGPRLPVADEEMDDYEDEEEEEEEEAPRHSTLLVVLLTVLIVALLAAGGFVFVRYFLPNMDSGEEETVPPTTEAQTFATETTELRIPCDTLFLNSSKQAELSQPGFFHLINVVIYPENTTDELTFTSADESIATVSPDGKITAVGQGETTVTIRCGDIEMQVNVVCNFEQETEPPTEEATEPAAEGETTGETTAEGTDSGEESEDGSKEVDPSIVLKLKKTDISLGVYYEYRLELDCDLDPKDVEWSSEHNYIAQVNEEGVVTAMMRGTTAIIAKYGSQSVQCIVRCS